MTHPSSYQGIIEEANASCLWDDDSRSLPSFHNRHASLVGRHATLLACLVIITTIHQVIDTIILGNLITSNKKKGKNKEVHI